METADRHKPPVRSRTAAGAALAVSVLTLAALVVFTVQALAYLSASVLCGVLSISMLWAAATRRRYRWAAAIGALALVGGAIACLVASGRGIVAVAVVVAGITVASVLGTLALRWEVRQVLSTRWQSVPAARRGVLILNPRSGDGKGRLGLADEARRRGIDVVVLEPGADLRALAETVAGGADALGMAGGDGSQAVVAAVAAARRMPFVCVPAGTRNHFALDLGINRDDPIGALDAFGPARETCIDLAEVNGQVFVNNVSLGLYARIVSSEKYRQAKQRTIVELLPDLLGPAATPFGLTIDAPDGPVTDATVIQVSNNPYRLSSLVGFGSRPRLDGGTLGVATLSISRTSDLHRLVALEASGHPERYQGWRQWSTHKVTVEGPPSVSAALDGEARAWEPPLRFVVRPRALRVRIGAHETGASPAFLHPPLSATTLVGLTRVLWGRPSGIAAGQPAGGT